MEKAQQALAKKAEKKEATPTAPTNRYRNNEASASQVLSSKQSSGNALQTKDIRIEGKVPPKVNVKVVSKRASMKWSLFGK